MLRIWWHNRDFDKPSYDRHPVTQKKLDGSHRARQKSCANQDPEACPMEYFFSYKWLIVVAKKKLNKKEWNEPAV
jgi:hypothetical protein